MMLGQTKNLKGGYHQFCTYSLHRDCYFYLLKYKVVLFMTETS
jgi:hypothetical protein